MAKSSRKQCRKPKSTKRQTGNLVVVSARHLHLNSTTKPAKTDEAPARGKQKGKRKTANFLGDLLRTVNDEADSDDAISSGLVGDGPNDNGKNDGSGAEFLFSSQHARRQRLYYLLVTRPSKDAVGTTGERGGSNGDLVAEEGGCHAVVFVETVGVAQELLGELKALTLSTFAVHERTPKAQAQEQIKRFLATPSAYKSSVLIITTVASARHPSIGAAPTATERLVRAVHFDAPEGPKDAAARTRLVGQLFGSRGPGQVQEVHLEGTGDAAGLPIFAYDIGALDGIRSRLAVAKKLARAVTTCSGGGDDKGMHRAAAAAGLEWDDRGGRSGNEEAAVKREKQRAQAQQVAALREKLRVLLCQPLLLDSVHAGGNVCTSKAKHTQQSSKAIRKKMALMGMISGQVSQVTATGASGGRCTAQTRWLDGSEGKAFGGEWKGAVRNGASADAASLEMRLKVDAAKKVAAEVAARRKDRGREDGFDDNTTALARWNPNPDSPDAERWGGRWGKPCGHNEIVLQHLRPFAPMEVINTRVCSKFSPAPGNTGFDGCLELLCLTCKESKRALTIWDESAFLFIDATGTCSALPKQTMLHLPLPTLRFLMKNMRSFTICREGQNPPREVARAVLFSAGWGAKQSRFGPLTTELSRRVLSFVLSGDLATWESVSVGLGADSGVPGRKAKAEGQRDTLAFASKKKRRNFNL